MLLHSHQLQASDLVDQSFIDFVRFVSNSSKQNIVIDESIDKRFSIVLPSNYKSEDSLPLLYGVLEKNGLEPILLGSTMYIKKIADTKKFYSIDLFFELPAPIINAITSNYPDLKVSSIQKSIAFKTDSKTYADIRSLVDVLDRSRPQRKLKVIMISFNDSDLREYGAKLSYTHQGANTVSFTSLINALSLGNSLSITSASSDFALSFSALESNGLAKIHLDNIVSLSDGKDSTIRAAKTIPYLSVENSIDGTNNVQKNNYQYKDVGTEILLTNVTVLDENLYFQANMKFEQLINDSITPTTSKREITNYLRIPPGQSLLISGIKSIDESINKSKIPLLGDIPYLGSLFRYESKSTKNETFAIYLENVSFEDINATVGLVK